MKTNCFEYFSMLRNMCVVLMISIASPAMATGEIGGTYQIGPGDVLKISVWKEADLQKDVLVKPDGSITFPLVGEVTASGLTTVQLTDVIKQKLQKYIPNAVLTVSVIQSGSNKIYVVGKVIRPGQYNAGHYMDVLQVLSLAGGLTPYADADDIKILRRTGDESEVFYFDYDDVIEGESLEMNIILKAGDTVMVP